MDFLPMIPLQESDIDKWQQMKVPDLMPAIVLRNSVLFPGFVSPITVNRDKSIVALTEGQKKSSQLVATLVQKDSHVDNPLTKDIASIGTIANIIKLITMPDDSITAIVQGIRRFKVNEIVQEDPFFQVNVSFFEEGNIPKGRDFKATTSGMKDLMHQVIQCNTSLPEELAVVLKNINHPRFLISFIASNLQLQMAEKLDILATIPIKEQAQKLLKILQREARFGELKKELTHKTRHEIEKQQKEYFLQQQLKNIKEELGGSSNEQEVENFKIKAKEKKWSKVEMDFFNKNLQKLERMHASSPEYAVVLNHLQLMLDLPWQEVSVDYLDIPKVRRTLNREHYKMTKIKERILEYIAVIKLRKDLKSPILCFIGPPGIGKTSLAQSVAGAIGRKSDRLSLGGVHDESEIRGHRKTYIGAMPGRVIQAIKKVGVSNPVLVLDEIDKLGVSSYGGDPSAAMLEVLDPEQNCAFHDNYLEIDYDLSKVFFIATANDASSIAPALRDRMEVVHLSGYDLEEKVQIAQKHLIKKQVKMHGIDKLPLQWTDDILQQLVDGYTSESGVRELERMIAAVCRSKAKQLVEEGKITAVMKKINLEKILDKPKFSKEKYKASLPAGVVTGLAWTQVGGSILHIESAVYEGKEELKVTGNVGKVMHESANAALTFIRSNAVKWKVDATMFKDRTIHIHIPEGATPKDGPSAGVTIFSSLLSLLSRKPIKSYLAMSGEITLRGQILPVGGIKEKVLVAKRSGIKYVYLPKQNQRDVAQIPASFLRSVQISYFSNVNELAKYIFQ